MKIRRLFVVAGMVAGAAGYACFSDYYHSVHFNSAQPDFGKPMTPYALGKNERGIQGGYNDFDSTWRLRSEEQERWSKRRLEVQKAASEAVRSERFDLALRLYSELLEGDEKKRRDGYSDWEERAVAPLLRDKIMVLQAALKNDVAADAVKEYLEAREVSWSEATAEAERKLADIYQDPKKGFLREFALYGKASSQYDEGDFLNAMQTYKQVAEEFPKSPLREMALIMVPRSALNIHVYNESDPPQNAEELISTSEVALETLFKDYPDSRFRDAARGWKARVDLINGRKVEAALHYLEMFRRTEREDPRALVNSLLSSFSGLTEPQALQLRKELEERPELIDAYLRFRIYFSPSDAQDLNSAAEFADAMLQKHPNTELGSDLLARLAEISFLKADYDSAGRFADRSLATEGKNRDLALYVKAGVLGKKGDHAQASALYEQVLKDHPKSTLTELTLENLAISSEKTGNFGRALEAYRKLEYEHDVSYILDIKMPVEQLQAYVNSRPSDPNRYKLRYALALRLMRKDRWDEAKRQLLSIPPEVRKVLAMPGSDVYQDPGWDDKVKSQVDVLQDPLKTIADLQKLRAAITKAKGSEQKAAAKYELASYWYKRRNLLLYNASLWHGARAVMIDFYWNPTVDPQADKKAVREHNFEQDCLLRARTLCLEIAREHPKTKAAPNALYRAAVAGRRVANLNEWWRNNNPGFLKKAIEELDRVVKNYPKAPIARAAEKYRGVYKDELAYMERYKNVPQP